MEPFEGFPLVIGWELTLGCNLHCKHCGSAAGRPRNKELSREETLAICDQLPELLVCEVNFTGGEPLFRRDWFQIATRLRDLKINTKLITNGVLLGPETTAQLRDAGVSRIGVSLDGLEATHDRIRGRPGLFKHVLRGIEQLLHAGLQVTVITTVTAPNVGELPALFALLHALDVDTWQFQPIFPLGRASNCAELALSEADYLQLGNFARTYSSPTMERKPLLLPGDSFGYYTDRDQRQPTWGGCSAGLLLCGITSDGRVKGCLSMPDELSEGDLRQRNLWDIWFDPNAFSYNRKFSLADLGPNCRACPLAQKCRGGCSSMSYACTGILHNDPLCFSGINQRAHTETRTSENSSVPSASNWVLV